MRGNSSAALDAGDIARVTAGRLVRGKPATRFNGVTTDSRRVKAGELFIALSGERFDGHDFLSEALRGGATGLVIRHSERERLEALPEAVAAIVVQEPLNALGDIARFWRRHFSMPLLAVTGSSGKTTTKEMTACVIGLEKRVLKNEGNFNNLIGLPLSLLNIREVHEAVVMEMGTNRRGEIARLTQIAEPSIGLVTNIGSAHLEGLKSIEALREEKGDLFRCMDAGGTVVINSDDPVVRDLAKGRRGPVITYGIQNDAQVRAENIQADGRLGVVFDLRIGGNAGPVALASPGIHNVYNALAAAAASWGMGIGPETIRIGLASFKPVSGRMEILALRNGAFVINDSYNANPEAVEAALRTVKDLNVGATPGMTMVVLGDMLELGEQAGALHEKIGGQIAGTGVGRLYLKGAFARSVERGALQGGLPGERIRVVETNAEIFADLRAAVRPGDWILVKGSRRMKMEEVVRDLVAAFGVKDAKE